MLFPISSLSSARSPAVQPQASAATALFRPCRTQPNLVSSAPSMADPLAHSRLVSVKSAPEDREPVFKGEKLKELLQKNWKNLSTDAQDFTQDIKGFGQEQSGAIQDKVNHETAVAQELFEIAKESLQNTVGGSEQAKVQTQVSLEGALDEALLLIDATKNLQSDSQLPRSLYLVDGQKSPLWSKSCALSESNKPFELVGSPRARQHDVVVVEGLMNEGFFSARDTLSKAIDACVEKGHIVVLTAKKPDTDGATLPKQALNLASSQIASSVNTLIKDQLKGKGLKLVANESNEKVHTLIFQKPKSLAARVGEGWSNASTTARKGAQNIREAVQQRLNQFNSPSAPESDASKPQSNTIHSQDTNNKDTNSQDTNSVD